MLEIDMDRADLPSDLSEEEESEKKKTKRTSAQADAPARGAEFEAFWQAYPRKTQKQDAARAFAKLAPSLGLQAVIFAALDRQKLSEQWQRGIIPHGATWLNQHRWEDEMPAASPSRPRSKAEAAVQETAKHLYDAFGGQG